MINFSKKLSILLVLVLVLAAFAGCASDGDGGDEGDAIEPITLSLAHFMSNMHPMHTEILAPFAEDVAEQTEGRVIIELYPNNELGAPTTTVDQVVSGAIDMGFTLPAYTPGRFPLTTILEFPFMFSSSLQGNKVAGDLRDTYQEVEYDEVKLLWIGGSDLGHLLSKKPITAIEDFNGMKLRSPGSVYNDVIQELGATEVSLPVSDLYDALDRDIVDATFMAPSGLISFKLSEVVTEVVELDLYMTPFIFFMNESVWDQISEEDQVIIEGLLEEFPVRIGEQYDHEIVAAMEFAEEENINISNLPEKEMTKFHELIDPLIEGWIADMEAQGLPGQETYDRALELAEEYK